MLVRYHVLLRYNMLVRYLMLVRYHVLCVWWYCTRVDVVYNCSTGSPCLQQQ